MAFNPRKYLTEEQINEIIDPISLAVGAGAAGLVGYGLHKLSSRRQRKAAEAKAEEQAREAYDTGAGRGEAAGRAEGMRSGIDAGKELLAREQYLRRAHERAGTRYSIAQHFGDPKIIQDAADHYKKLQTGWQTVLSSDDANKGYVNAPHTFHMAVDKIKLHKDQAMSDDIARYYADNAGGRIEDYSTHTGHNKLLQLIRSTAKNEGQRGLDKLTRTLVHHKHHDDEDAMGMARILIHHLAHRIDERYPRYENGGHQFHSEQGPVWYHRDLPHPTNATIDAEVLRHKILRDLFTGTYKPDGRVLDTVTSRGTYVDHKKHGRILDINSLSRDRRAFEVDQKARGDISYGKPRHIAAGDPVLDGYGSGPQFHGQPIGSAGVREFETLITRSAQQRKQQATEQEKIREAEAKAAQKEAEKQARAAAKEAEAAAIQAPPAVQPIAPPAAPVAPIVPPMAPAEAPKGEAKPKGKKGKRGRPKKVQEAMDFYSWMIDKQMSLRKN